MNTYVNNINNECKKRQNVKNKFDENEKTFAIRVENDSAYNQLVLLNVVKKLHEMKCIRFVNDNQIDYDTP